MKVTEQIDALEASAVDPYKLLVVTRVLACILMIPLLTILPGFCGIFMGWVPDTLAEPISLALFMRQAFERVTYSDLLPATLKTAMFGLIIEELALPWILQIAWISRFIGTNEKRNFGATAETPE